MDDIEYKGNVKIVSNHVGPDGESVDRIYGGQYGTNKVRLVNRDYSEYKGEIKKKTILKKGLDGKNFRSYVYVTADDRWFDRAGLPITKESVTLDKESDDATQD